MLLYVVAYDIPDDKRRRKVSHLLQGYGRRVQYSVFELVVSSGKFDELRLRLKKLVRLSEDNIRFYPVSGHTLAQVEAWGVGPDVTEAPESVVI